MVRPRAGRSASPAAALVAAVGCALVLGLSGCGRHRGRPRRPRSRGHGVHVDADEPVPVRFGGLLRKVRYPGVVQEAIARIREAHPDAVTFNEACSGDVARIARRTGYHVRFSTVIYYGRPLPCIRPGGRGLFGDAVLTRAAIESAVSHPFTAEAGPEQRQWLCAGTRIGVEVCTAHLASPERG